MRKNMHSLDRMVRFLFAVVVAILFFTKVISGTLALVLGLAAIILLVTAVINFCPLYHLFGISTRNHDHK